MASATFRYCSCKKIEKRENENKGKIFSENFFYVYNTLCLNQWNISMPSENGKNEEHGKINMNGINGKIDENVCLV